MSLAERDCMHLDDATHVKMCLCVCVGVHANGKDPNFNPDLGKQMMEISNRYLFIKIYINVVQMFKL